MLVSTICIDPIKPKINPRNIMIMSRDQTAGGSYGKKIDDSSIERVEEFKYLETTLTNKNSIQEEIKSRLKLGNACFIRCRIFYLAHCSVWV